jgi:hypothetical protein
MEVYIWPSTAACPIPSPRRPPAAGPKGLCLAALLAAREPKPITVFDVALAESVHAHAEAVGRWVQLGCGQRGARNHASVAALTDRLSPRLR